jgi:pimeloyl-ACP methyl ester carboxylesterase
MGGGVSPAYVSGASADGVTQVLVEVPAAQAGDTVELTLLNENNQQDTVTNDGGLFALGGSPTSAASTISIQAQNTSSPMAFAIYKTASNFYRGSQDAATAVRNLTLQASCSSAGGAPTTAPVPLSLVRPPVVLVHGIWSSPAQAWSNFTPVNATNLQLWGSIGVQNPQYSLYKYPVNYSAPVSVTATVPAYGNVISTVSGNAIGFAYNAGIVQVQTLLAIADFEDHYNVAAVQADVVAHSMGGDIARVMGGGGPAFADQGNYGFGPIHKLITIGTPHQGTPLAVDLLPGASGDPNGCVRNTLAANGEVSLQSETISGVSINGAVGDFAAAPSNLPATEPFPMAFLAGSTNSNSLKGLGNTGSGLAIFAICGTLAGDPLGYDLGQNYWTLLVFSNAANDGIVPVTSQLNTGQANGTTSTTANTLSGVIHSPGIEPLGFNPPSELDASSGIPDAVVNLLNEATNGADFY